LRFRAWRNLETFVPLDAWYKFKSHTKLSIFIIWSKPVREEKKIWWIFCSLEIIHPESTPHRSQSVCCVIYLQMRAARSFSHVWKRGVPQTNCDRALSVSQPWDLSWRPSALEAAQIAKFNCSRFRSRSGFAAAEGLSRGGLNLVLVIYSKRLDI
jgi:hypothetical protein